MPPLNGVVERWGDVAGVTSSLGVVLHHRPIIYGRILQPITNVVFYTAFSISHLEVSLITPTSSPAILNDPISSRIIVSNYDDRVIYPAIIATPVNVSIPISAVLASYPHKSP